STRRLLPRPLCHDGLAETLARNLAIKCLRPCVLHRDAHSGRPVPQHYSSRHLVNVLAARSGRTRKALFKVTLPEFHYSGACLILSGVEGFLSICAPKATDS